MPLTEYILKVGNLPLMKHLKIFAVIISVLIFSGCAAHIQETSKTANRAVGKTPQSVFLDITSSHSVSKSKSLSNSINELKALIAKDFNGSIVESGSAEQAPLSVEITIEHFRYVSGFGRFMVGVMAGDAELKLNVKLINTDTNEVVGESILDTRSEFIEGIFGATTSRQLEAVSKKVVSMIGTVEREGKTDNTANS
ncbi:DUF4410 domain-containing protein [Pseudoalteromonas maricaloris]